jgi:hypothetical protein
VSWSNAVSTSERKRTAASIHSATSGRSAGEPLYRLALLRSYSNFSLFSHISTCYPTMFGHAMVEILE